MIALMTFLLLQGYWTNFSQPNCHGSNVFYISNRNSFLTSDTGISSRWIPSKHFHVADIVNSELLCLKENGSLKYSCNVWKKLCGKDWIWNKGFRSGKNFHFWKTQKCTENVFTFIFFHSERAHDMSWNEPKNN